MVTVPLESWPLVISRVLLAGSRLLRRALTLNQLLAVGMGSPFSSTRLTSKLKVWGGPTRAVAGVVMR